MSSVQTILLLVTAATVVLCPTTSLWAQPVTQPHVEQRDDGLESKLVGSQRGAGNGESEWKAWLQMLLALAVVVAMIFGLRWLLKRLSGGTMGGGRAGVLEVVARTGVTTKQELMLVRLGERLVLLGRSPGAMARLAEVTDAKEVQRLRAMIDGRGEEIEKKGGEV